MKILKNEKNIGTHGTEPMDLRGGQVGLEKHTTPPPKKKHRQIGVRPDTWIDLSKTWFEGLSFTDQKDNNILKFKLAFISNDRNISPNSFVDEMRVN